MGFLSGESKEDKQAKKRSGAFKKIRSIRCE